MRDFAFAVIAGVVLASSGMFFERIVVNGPIEQGHLRRIESLERQLAIAQKEQRVLHIVDPVLPDWPPLNRIPATNLPVTPCETQGR
jgi:hypothetical protein